MKVTAARKFNCHVFLFSKSFWYFCNLIQLISDLWGFERNQVYFAFGSEIHILSVSAASNTFFFLKKSTLHLQLVKFIPVILCSFQLYYVWARVARVDRPTQLFCIWIFTCNIQRKNISNSRLICQGGKSWQIFLLKMDSFCLIMLVQIRSCKVFDCSLWYYQPNLS